MFIDPDPLFEFKLRRSERYAAPPELWILWGAVRTINIALLTELETVRDDNPPDLMYKGKAEQPSNPRMAYAGSCASEPKPDLVCIGKSARRWIRTVRYDDLR